MTPLIYIQTNVINSEIQKDQNSVQFAFIGTSVLRTASFTNKFLFHVLKKVGIYSSTTKVQQ